MNLPPEILTTLIAMAPVTELRASIPIAMTVYGFSAVYASLWSLIGGAIATWLLLNWLEILADFFSKKIALAKKILNWIFERTRRRTADKYLKYGILLLVLFVAIPAPGTGFWTGSIIAFLFNIPKTKAFIYIMLGLVLSSVLIALVTLGLINIFV